MPNAFAFLVLAAWPIASLYMYRKFDPSKALIWSIVLGYLFLPPPPTGFSLPGLVPFNKDILPGLVAAFACVVILKTRLRFLPEAPLAKVLVILFVFTPVATVAVNGDPLVFHLTTVPGLQVKDMVGLTFQQFTILLPFILARQFLNTEEDLNKLIKAIFLAGLLYSVFVLIEVRTSPQLNRWIYGFYQFSFEQAVRGGGYRPTVFLYHGLWTAFFTMMAAISAFAIWRARKNQKRTKFLMVGAYFSGVLLLSNSLGSLLFLILLAPMVLFFSQRLQVAIAVAMACICIAYPLLRGGNAIPADKLVEVVRNYSEEERAGSLWFRLHNEEILLERVALKPVLGWGSWGRNHVHDPITGEIVSVTDGRWIITIGTYGWVGYLAEFGLLALPLFLLLGEMRKAGNRRVSPYVGATALILGINMIDMLPNATLTPLTWLVVGALLGYAEMLKVARLSKQPGAAPDEQVTPELVADRPRTVM